MTSTEVAEVRPHILALVDAERRPVAAAILDAAAAAADYDTDTSESLVCLAKYYADRFTVASLALVATLALLIRGTLDGEEPVQIWADGYARVIRALNDDLNRSR
jgi:hypothetical protein